MGLGILLPMCCNDLFFSVSSTFGQTPYILVAREVTGAPSLEVLDLDVKVPCICKPFYDSLLSTKVLEEALDVQFAL